MLQRFFRSKRVPLIPSAWLNAVSNYLNGIHSKTDTIKIDRVDSVDSGIAPSIDLNEETAARRLRPFLSKDFVCRGDRSTLGEGLIWTENGLSIDKAWLERQIVQSFKA